MTDPATEPYKRLIDGARPNCMVAFRPWRFVNYRSGRRLRLIARPIRKAQRR